MAYKYCLWDSFLIHITVQIVFIRSNPQAVSNNSKVERETETEIFTLAQLAIVFFFPSQMSFSYTTVTI